MRPYWHLHFATNKIHRRFQRRNLVPIFEITGWVARPAALAGGESAEPEVQFQAPASKPAPTPVAKPAPSPAMSDDEMFS